MSNGRFFLLLHTPYFIICPFHDNLLNVKTENFYDRLGDKFCVGRASGYIKEEMHAYDAFPLLLYFVHPMHGCVMRCVPLSTDDYVIVR